MSRHKCAKCGYSTPSKFNLVRHQDNDYGCANLKKSAETSEDLIIETPKNDVHLCKLCNTTFSRKDKLTQHERTAVIHQKNLELHNNKMNHVKINSDNNTTNITNHGMILNINYVPTPENIVPHHYLYTNIDDLTLFRQYCLFCHNISVGCSPFKAFLDSFQLNPEMKEYHNVRYTNYKNKNIDIHNGDNWNVGNFDNIQAMIDVIGDLLSHIFNKFRIFLGRRSHIYGIKHLYYGMKCSRGIKKNNEDVRLHIHNKGKNMRSPEYSDENIPQNRDHPIWNSLSKTFDSWDEVAALINKITDFGISFDNDIETIRDHLVDKIVGSKKYNKFFSKFFDRIYLLMNQYNHVHQYEQNISSDGDELNKFNEMCDGLPKKRTKEELHEINEKNKKVKVNPDDHIGMSPKVRYHGYKKIGKKFQSDEDESKFHFI